MKPKLNGTEGQDRESYSDTQDRENYSVPVRRGTGPKARLVAFLKAYDAFMKTREGELSIGWQELEMIEARKGVTTNLGLG